MDCFSQLQVLNKALVIKEQLPVFGECGWQEGINRLQVVASEWNLKKSLLQAWGLILRANVLDGVNLGNSVVWFVEAIFFPVAHKVCPFYFSHWTELHKYHSVIVLICRS